MKNLPMKGSDLAELFNPLPVSTSTEGNNSSKHNSNLDLYTCIGAAIVVIGVGIYFYIKLEKQHSQTLSLLERSEAQNHFLMKALKDANSSSTKINNNENTTEKSAQG